MNIDIQQFDQAAEAYRTKWQGIDRALARLCRECPDHHDRLRTNAKIWIIGRAFSTGIERLIPSDRTQGSAMEALCDYLHAHADRADAILGQLREVRSPCPA